MPRKPRVAVPTPTAPERAPTPDDDAAATAPPHDDADTPDDATATTPWEGALAVYDPAAPVPLAVRVRHWRKARQWTQTELAARCGIDQGFISQIETGRIAKPSPEYLRALAKGFGVPITEMFIAAGYMVPADMVGELTPYLDRYVASLRSDAEIMRQLRALDDFTWSDVTFGELADALRLHLRMILRERDGGDPPRHVGDEPSHHNGNGAAGPHGHDG